MRKSEISTEIIAGNILLESRVVEYDREEIVIDIVNSIARMESMGYRIKESRVHGNDESLIIHYERKY